MLWANRRVMHTYTEEVPSARSGRNRPVSATYASCWAQANKLPDSMDAGEPISWPMRQDE